MKNGYTTLVNEVWGSELPKDFEPSEVECHLIDKRLNGMDTRHAQVLRMYYGLRCEAMPTWQIAQELGISHRAVEVRRRAGLAAIKTYEKFSYNVAEPKPASKEDVLQYYSFFSAIADKPMFREKLDSLWDNRGDRSVKSLARSLFTFSVDLWGWKLTMGTEEYSVQLLRKYQDVVLGVCDKYNVDWRDYSKVVQEARRILSEAAEAGTMCGCKRSLKSALSSYVEKNCRVAECADLLDACEQTLPVNYNPQPAMHYTPELPCIMDKALAQLTPREGKVLRMLYGLGGEDALSVKAVSEVFNLSQDRVRQIHSKALRKLRRPRSARLFESYVGGAV